MMVMGEGRHPTVEHLIKLGNVAKIPKAIITEIIEQTRTALAKWGNLAKEHGVSATNIKLINKKILGIT